MFDLEFNILSKSGLSPEQILEACDLIRADHQLHGVITPACVVEKDLGINALWIVAHAATETGWGLSRIAQTKNNYFGFNAIDSDPSKASSYKQPHESVLFYGNFLKEHYLTKGGKYFNGATPHGVMVCYASAGDRAAKTIVSIMNMLAERAGKKAPDGFPQKDPKSEKKDDRKPAEKEPEASKQPEKTAQDLEQQKTKAEGNEANEPPKNPESPASDESTTGTEPKKN